MSGIFCFCFSLSTILKFCIYNSISILFLQFYIRGQMCTGAGSTSLNYESSKLRNGNFFIKSLLLLLAVIIMIAANWKKKALDIRKLYQRNVLTLTQTMAVLVFLYINGVISDYLFLPSENNSIFVLEMLRVIFLENISFKFLFPIFLIYRTQSLPLSGTEHPTYHYSCSCMFMIRGINSSRCKKAL